jgi:sialic acid synthase SpsE
MLEKHFTLDKSMPGPDHAGSADSNDMKQIVSWVRTMELASGSDRIEPVGEEKEARLLKRRAIYAAKDMDKGSYLRVEDVALLTPSSPKSQLEDLNRFVGRPLKIDIMKGDLITVDVF